MRRRSQRALLLKAHHTTHIEGTAPSNRPEQSRGAAQECSPRREPWGMRETTGVEPRGGGRGMILERPSFAAPRLVGEIPSPRAHALGYILLPLRGLASR